MKIQNYILICFLFVASNAFSSDTLSCSQLSDGFCRQLWSKDNLGNLTLSDGNTISQGATPSKLISNSTYLYFRKIIDRKCKLPQDLQTELHVNCEVKSSDDLLYRLDAHLKLALDPNFKQTIVAIKAWRKEFATIRDNISEVLNDVELARLLAAYPELSQKKPAKLTDKEQGLISDSKYNFSREWMDAVYLGSPEWKRVKTLFTNVQSEIIKLVDNMGLDTESADFMRQKVASVQLTLSLM